MEALSKIWIVLDKVIFTLVKWVCVVLLGMLVAVVFYIFFGRYVLNHSPMWGEPLSLFCLVWMSILGSALVVRSNEHIRVTMFDERMGKGALFSSDILAAVCILVFAVFMIKFGWQLTASATRNNMAGINVPYSWMYISMPVSGVLYILALIEMWRRRIAGK